MSRHEVQDYLASLEKFGIKLGLRNMHRALDRLAIPYQKLSVIHIAGTNGKGSSASMMAHMLAACHVRVGLYTSPHLSDVRERMIVIPARSHQRKMISSTAFDHSVLRLRSACNQRPKISITFFEALTLIAIDYFLRAKVKCAVIETGLGGRFDATNVLKPLLSVITSVEKDHTQWLGSSLESIAMEKAGIIKQNVPCVTTAMHKSVLKVLQKRCLSQNAPLYRVIGKRPKVTTVRGGSFPPRGETFSMATPKHFYPHIRCPLLGLHQISNTAGALCAVDLLQEHFPRISPERMRKGLARTVWPGRFEWISRKLPVIIDGAHNVEACRVLTASIREYFPKHRIYLILSILDDKDFKGMCEELLPLVAKQIHLVGMNTPRNHRLGRVQAFIKGRRYQTQMFHDVNAAYQEFDRKAAGKPRRLVLVAGSIYLAGLAREAFGLGEQQN